MYNTILTFCHLIRIFYELILDILGMIKHTQNARIENILSHSIRLSNLLRVIKERNLKLKELKQVI